VRLVGETVVKTRVAASGVPMLRLDSGAGRPADGALPRAVEVALAGAGAVLVADYGRGVAALPALRRRLAALAADVPVVWDPHPKGPAPVSGAALATPNAAEAAQFGEGADVADSGQQLCERWAVQAVAVTQGERGALLTLAGARSVHVPLVGSATTASHPRPDTCGAGDQFAASATAALLGGADVESAVRTAVMEAAAYVTGGAAASVSVRVPAVADVEVASGLTGRGRRAAGSPDVS
jgi:bifunctional ADP-heptose synthase (sugar kinase/adenylyltransferase)